MGTPDKQSGVRGGDGVPPVFLERSTYRRRRIRDAARLLPLLGFGFFMIPLLWPVSANSDLTEPVRTSAAITYIFAVWGGLILTCAALGAWMNAPAPRRGKERG